MFTGMKLYDPCAKWNMYDHFKELVYFHIYKGQKTSHAQNKVIKLY